MLCVLQLAASTATATAGQLQLINLLELVAADYVVVLEGVSWWLLLVTPHLLHVENQAVPGTSAHGTLGSRCTVTLSAHRVDAVAVHHHTSELLTWQRWKLLSWDQHLIACRAALAGFTLVCALAAPEVRVQVQAQGQVEVPAQGQVEVQVQAQAQGQVEVQVQVQAQGQVEVQVTADQE